MFQRWHRSDNGTVVRGHPDHDDRVEIRISAEAPFRAEWFANPSTLAKLTRLDVLNTNPSRAGGQRKHEIGGGWVRDSRSPVRLCERI